MYNQFNRYSGSHLGMVFFYYNNNSSDRKLIETVTATNIKNLKIEAPNQSRNIL